MRVAIPHSLPTRCWKRAWFVALVWAVVLQLSGCQGARIEVPKDFPIPLLEPLPLEVGLVLSEALTSYVHEEEIPENGTWRISIGAAQATVFNNLFTGMFAHYEQIADTSAQAQGPRLQGTLEPSIADVQFSTPTQTRSDYFEVWIRYQIKLYDQGVLLGEWPITAYGKANVQNYGISPSSPALQEAARAACRDAMAYFAIEFQKVPAVRSWIASKTAEPSS